MSEEYKESDTCYSECIKQNKKCQVKDCRLWIDYEKDLNCTEIAIQKNDKLTLSDVGERLRLTPSRIKQIEKESISKVTKAFNRLKII